QMTHRLIEIIACARLDKRQDSYLVQKTKYFSSRDYSTLRIMVMTELFAHTHSSKDTMTWRSDSTAIEAASDKTHATIEAVPSQALAKNVLFISYAFLPSIEMGARTCSQIARYLPLYGWKPVVLTIDESYIEKRYLKHSPTATNEEPFDIVIRTK